LPIKEKLLHPLRVLKSWLEGFAEKRYAAFALFLCGFIEASLFPLSPDVLLIALGVSNPRKSLWYSLIVVAGSSVGALMGYYVGYALYDAVGNRIVEFLGVGNQFHLLLDEYRVNAWLALLLAGFTMIPFMVFSMAAGFNATVDPATVFLAALCGRVIRFVPLGILLHVFGSRAKHYFDHFLGRTVLALGLVVILLFIAARYLF
jgi:membrane protein YqaA with SNARE-associated domain